MRAAGVHVEVGRLEEQARHLNEAFARYIRHRTPLVTLKAAMTLDGKIAPPPAEELVAPTVLPPADGSRAKSPALTCRNCAIKTTRCWSEQERFFQTIPCSPTAAADRDGVHCCA